MPARSASAYFAVRIVAPPGRNRERVWGIRLFLPLRQGKMERFSPGLSAGGYFVREIEGKVGKRSIADSSVWKSRLFLLLAMGYTPVPVMVVTTGLDDILVHTLALSSDGTLFAGTSGKGIVRFKAQSTGWVRQQNALKDHEGMTENFIRVLTIDPAGGIYAGTFGGGVFLSVDGGVTWQPISRALPNDSIRGILFNSRGLFVATGHGIFKTTDRGRQWVPLNKGLTSMAVQVLIESGAGVLYAGTSDGAFRSDDDGRTWNPINQGLESMNTPSPFRFR
jgi:ligand-binding sensor domain-containing protein